LTQLAKDGSKLLRVSQLSFASAALSQNAIMDGEQVMSEPLLGILAHTGLVRMDDFEGLATWDGGGSSSVVIKFNGEVLSSERLEQLNVLRAHGEPVKMRFPGCEERMAKIVGHSLRDNTIYITWI
jgi:hypothetical protein